MQGGCIRCDARHVHFSRLPVVLETEGKDSFGPAGERFPNLILRPVPNGDRAKSLMYRKYKYGSHFLKDKWRDNKIRQLVFSQGKGLLIDFYCV